MAAKLLKTDNIIAIYFAPSPHKDGSGRVHVHCVDHMGIEVMIDLPLGAAKEIGTAAEASATIPRD
jgi:hypothetical protein